MISHILDTCAFLDLIAGRWANTEAREVMLHSKSPVLLSISVWEMGRKLRLGKLLLPCDLEGLSVFVDRVCAHYRIHLQSLDADTCYRAELLPAHHDDPFDRMILAFALKWEIPVFSTDRQFEAYPVKVIRQR